jgi:D-alanyl-D-alanine dipeptidase
MTPQEITAVPESLPMTLEERIERSRSMERIDYSQIGCLHIDEPLVEMHASENIIIEPFWTIEGDFEGDRYKAYMAEHPEYTDVYIRPELMRRVEKAAASLGPRYKMIVRAAHRPLEVQRRLLIDCMQDYKNEHPEASDEEASEHARTFVDDPDNPDSWPSHSVGAIDIDLFDIEKSELVDFGSTTNDDNERSYLHYEGLTPEQKEKRMKLLSAMLAQGLASTAFEWWHYSYGDKTWAWFYWQKNSLYGPAEPDFDQLGLEPK